MTGFLDHATRWWFHASLEIGYGIGMLLFVGGVISVAVLYTRWKCSGACWRSSLICVKRGSLIGGFYTASVAGGGGGSRRGHRRDCSRLFLATVVKLAADLKLSVQEC